jgi:hypothetical protein
MFSRFRVLRLESPRTWCRLCSIPAEGQLATSEQGKGHHIARQSKYNSSSLFPCYKASIAINENSPYDLINGEYPQMSHLQVLLTHEFENWITSPQSFGGNSQVIAHVDSINYLQDPWLSCHTKGCHTDPLFNTTM